MSTVQRIDMLLVDDSPSDAKLIDRWLSTSPLVRGVQILPDGERVLDVLRSSTGVRPNLVLLDINLPGHSGFDVLTELKADADLSRIPVIMLTGSQAPEDSDRALALKAHMCLAKPSDADEFTELVSTLETFWRRFSGEPFEPAG